MLTAQTIHPKYVMDESGHKTAVILPISEFDELLEDLDDLAVVAERRDEPCVPHSQVAAELKDNGYLPG